LFPSSPASDMCCAGSLIRSGRAPHYPPLPPIIVLEDAGELSMNLDAAGVRGLCALGRDGAADHESAGAAAKLSPMATELGNLPFPDRRPTTPFRRVLVRVAHPYDWSNGLSSAAVAAWRARGGRRVPALTRGDWGRHDPARRSATETARSHRGAIRRPRGSASPMSSSSITGWRARIRPGPRRDIARVIAAPPALRGVWGPGTLSSRRSEQADHRFAVLAALYGACATRRASLGLPPELLDRGLHPQLPGGCGCSAGGDPRPTHRVDVTGRAA